MGLFLLIFILIVFLIAIGMCGGLIAICAIGNFLNGEENHENITKRD